MLNRVERTISRYNMIAADGPVGVAVSGGADSVFLLHALRALVKNPLVVLHVNHGLRGAESEADESFVRSLHEDVVVERMPPPEGNVEQFCRRARKAFFMEMIASGRVACVATGHTATDQAETVLMRLLRGTGPMGLRGVLAVTKERIVRPLLELQRAEIRQWLTAHGIVWREDSSNASEHFLRNRVRDQLLPLLRSWQPSIDQTLARTAAIAALEETYWRELVAGVSDVVDVADLRAQHPARAARTVRAAIASAMGGLERIEQQHIAAVLALAWGEVGSGSADIPGGRAVRSFRQIKILRRDRDAPVGGELVPPFSVTAGAFVIGGAIDAAGAIDWERITPPLRLKQWEPGDRFQDRPVRQYFQKLRVPSWERPFWPMISDSAGIIWIHGIGVAARAAAGEGTTSRLAMVCHRVSSK
jgi:tRNA(Ile)-lysidine synthase